MYNSPAFSKNHLWNLLIFIIFSLLFHAVVIVTIPNFLSVKRIEIIPVVYIRPMEVRIKKLPPFPAANKEPPKRHQAPIKMERDQFILKKVQSISVGKGLFLPPPSMQLPVSEFLGKEKITESYASKGKNQERLGRYPFKSGLPTLLPRNLTETTSLPSSRIGSSFSERLIKELKREIRSEHVKSFKSKKLSKTAVKKVSNVRLGVEGPISVRKILFQPPLPKVVAEHSVQIKLKFWVTPSGIIDQIIPVERGGAQMESVAIRFLKGWKFEPLPSEVRQERQWGILTVKFLVK